MPVVGESTYGWVGREENEMAKGCFREKSLPLWVWRAEVAGMKFERHRPLVKWARGLNEVNWGVKCMNMWI